MAAHEWRLVQVDGTDPADRAAGAGAGWPTGRVRPHIPEMAVPLFALLFLY
jgi:hypothetical protein